MTQNSFMLESVQQLTKIVAIYIDSDEYCLGSKSKAKSKKNTVLNIYFAKITMNIQCHSFDWTIKMNGQWLRDKFVD